MLGDHHRHFTRFLERSSARVGKVTQDHFWLTLRTVFWSILVASPLPVLWMTLGYGLREAWPYPLAVAIGDGVTARNAGQVDESRRDNARLALEGLDYILSEPITC